MAVIACKLGIFIVSSVALADTIWKYSFSELSDSIDLGKWMVELSLWLPAQYVAALEGLGCDVAEPVPLIDSWTDPDGKHSDTYGECVAMLISGVKK